MADDPQDAPRKKPSDIVLGQDLSHLSEHELSERILALDVEIARCKTAIVERQTTKSAADAIFKR